MKNDYLNNRPEMSTPEYRNWKFGVFSRDEFKCQLCHAPKGKPLEAHHIIPWSQAPNLRYIQMNGISLCVDCHKLTFGKEDEYIERFQKIVQLKKIESQGHKKIKGLKTNEYKYKWRPENPRRRY